MGSTDDAAAYVRFWLQNVSMLRGTGGGILYPNPSSNRIDIECKKKSTAFLNKYSSLKKSLKSSLM